MTAMTRLLVIAALGAGLVGCGGGGGGDGGGGGAAAPLAASIEASPQAALLTQSGQEKSLGAVVRDAQGQAIDNAPLAWTSSDPALVVVDASGRVRALGAVGSAWVSASSGGVTSAPVLVTIAQPVAGARLLEDRQFVSGPVAVNPGAEPAAGALYEVVLRDITGLVPGTLLVSAEAAPVAGRVEAVVDDGDGRLRVQLAAVTPSQLFADWSFSNRVALAQTALAVPPELAALYTVEREGDRFDFTPRPASSNARREHPAAVQGTRALGPFGCVGETTQAAQLPVTLSVPPIFSITVSGDAAYDATPAGTRLRLTSQPVLKVSAEVDVVSAFEAKLECRVVLLQAPVRAPGWAALFFGGQVTLGAGFEVGGKVTLVAAKLGATVDLKPAISADLRCAAGSCELGGDVEVGKFVVKPVLKAPSIDQTQFEPSAGLFAFIDLNAGGPISDLQFEAVKSKAGLGLSANLTLESLQIGNRHAEDGRAKYELKFAGEIGPGIRLGGLLSYLGLSAVVPLKLTFEKSLGTSPTGTVTADREAYGPNAPATVTVKLDPASTNFPASSSFYNVERIVLLRRTGAATVEVLAAADATDGQTTFTLAFTNGATGLWASDVHAFVVTKALPLDPPRLEIGAALVPIGYRSSLAYVAASLTFPDNSFTYFLQEQQETTLIEDPPFTRRLERSATIPTNYDRRGTYNTMAETLRDEIDTDPVSGEVRGGAFGVRARCSTSDATFVAGLTPVKHVATHSSSRLLYVITNGRSAATLRVSGLLSIVAQPGQLATDARAYFGRSSEPTAGASISTLGGVNSKPIGETFTVLPYERISIGVELFHGCHGFQAVPETPAEASLSFTLTPLP